MKDSKDLVASALKTAQMGQVGIRCVMHLPLAPTLRQALTSQINEYHAIEQEAQALASKHGWTLKELSPAMKTMANMVCRMQSSGGDMDSKAAAMTIQGNTRGIIKGYKNFNQYDRSDSDVTALMQKLLDCEKENIQQMQRFL